MVIVSENLHITWRCAISFEPRPSEENGLNTNRKRKRELGTAWGTSMLSCLVPCLTPELNKRLETIQEKFNRMEKMIQDLKKTAS
jgi:hypothetical protein